MTENYYDGKWRLIIEGSDATIDKLLSRGFEIRISKGEYMARWSFELPTDPLVFIGCNQEEIYSARAVAQVEMAYWQETRKAGS